MSDDLVRRLIRERLRIYTEARILLGDKWSAFKSRGTRLKTVKDVQCEIIRKACPGLKFDRKDDPLVAGMHIGAVAMLRRARRHRLRWLRKTQRIVASQ